VLCTDSHIKEDRRLPEGSAGRSSVISSRPVFGRADRSGAAPPRKYGGAAFPGPSDGVVDSVFFSKTSTGKGDSDDGRPGHGSGPDEFSSAGATSTSGSALLAAGQRTSSRPRPNFSKLSYGPSPPFERSYEQR